VPTSSDFRETMRASRHSFFLPRTEIVDAEFDGTPKWGMGKIVHSGKLRLRLRSGRRRQFSLLGEAYGDGICRYILEGR
jgi:hypothetical protein